MEMSPGTGKYRVFIEGVNGYDELMEMEYPELYTTPAKEDENEYINTFQAANSYSAELKVRMVRRVRRILLGWSATGPLRRRLIFKAVKLQCPPKKWRRNRGA